MNDSSADTRKLIGNRTSRTYDPYMKIRSTLADARQVAADVRDGTESITRAVRMNTAVVAVVGLVAVVALVVAIAVSIRTEATV